MCLRTTSYLDIELASDLRTIFVLTTTPDLIFKHMRPHPILVPPTITYPRATVDAVVNNIHKNDALTVARSYFAI